MGGWRCSRERTDQSLEATTVELFDSELYKLAAPGRPYTRPALPRGGSRQNHLRQSWTAAVPPSPLEAVIQQQQIIAKAWRRDRSSIPYPSVMAAEKCRHHHADGSGGRLDRQPGPVHQSDRACRRRRQSSRQSLSRHAVKRHGQHRCAVPMRGADMRCRCAANPRVIAPQHGKRIPRRQDHGRGPV